MDGVEAFTTNLYDRDCYGSDWFWPTSVSFVNYNPTIATASMVQEGEAQAQGSAPGQAIAGSGSHYVQEYQDDGMDCYPWSHFSEESEPIDVAPTITGPNTVWYFGGQNPAGYGTQITLSSSGGSGTTWTVTAGANKINLSTTAGSQTTVTSTGSAFSSASGDIKVKATANGVASPEFAITSRTPHRLVAGTILHQCDSGFGYSDNLNYTIQDQLLANLPSGVPLNERWTTAVVNDYQGTNWGRPSEGSFTTSGSGFSDHITGVSVFLPGGPVPVPVCSGNPAAVHHWGQEWRIGSLAIGIGKRVQTNTLKRFADHAAHEGIIHQPHRWRKTGQK